MAKDTAVIMFIQRVNQLIESSPLAAAKAARYHIPPYDLARHNEIVSALQEFGIDKPNPEQALHAHVVNKQNPPKPRQRKK